MGVKAGPGLAEPTRPPKILLVEDEVNVAKGLQLVLSEAGFQVDWAATGQEALALCRRQTYQLLVADLYLPDLDGLEVIKWVRTRQPQIRVIVITGYASVASAIAALKMGVADYLEKPFTDEEIKSAVKAALIRPNSSPQSRWQPTCH